MSLTGGPGINKASKSNRNQETKLGFYPFNPKTAGQAVRSAHYADKICSNLQTCFI